MLNGIKSDKALSIEYPSTYGLTRSFEDLWLQAARFNGAAAGVTIEPTRAEISLEAKQAEASAPQPAAASAEVVRFRHEIKEIERFWRLQIEEMRLWIEDAVSKGAEADFILSCVQSHLNNLAPQASDLHSATTHVDQT